MRRLTLWPRGVVGRSVMVLLLGLAVSQVAGIVIYANDRADTQATLRGREVAERLAAALSVIGAAPAEERPGLIPYLRGAGFHLSWSPDQPLVEAAADDWRADLLYSALADVIGDFPRRRLRVAFREVSPLPPGFAMMHGPGGGQGMGAMMGQMSGAMMGGADARLLNGSFRLDDDSWLNFITPFVHLGPFWAAPSFLHLMVAGTLVILISVWAVWRSTVPLALFARAAERLGMDVDAPPLPEEGPREVRRASRSFNDMQRRIRGFVHDRTQMLAAISHDLRTPITRLRLRAEFIEDEEQQRKMLADLEEMETMIAATLSFAREDDAHEAHRPLDMAALVESICEDMTEAGHRVTYQGPSRMTYSGRPVALKRAIGNLLENAVRYGGGATAVLAAAGGGLTLCIDDDGPGLPEEELEKVFAAFYRFEGSRSRETGGTGLGLAAVRSIVRAHGGEVTLSNRAQGGLRAEITLPALAVGSFRVFQD